MKFSELWLREWVNPAVSSDELAGQLTMAGLEVDGIDAVAGAFHHVISGSIVECRQHPHADKLQVAKVDIGGERLLNIVCGASNCRPQLKVAVALPGAVLPGDVNISVAELRGELSEGMLCSFAELGIDSDKEGIIELPEDAPLGSDVRQLLKLDDKVIEISVTPNRADCLSIIGVARDIAAVNQIRFTEPDITAVAAVLNHEFSIQIDEPEACPRYLARLIKNVNINALSPLWMQEKLRRSGLKSINPVVDVTNFVLLELGQPMHAFDFDRIDGQMTVRMATENEELTLFNGVTVKLNTDTLVTADEKKVLAMSGICGGEYSGVSKQTRHVLLECAFFYPSSIAGRARRHGLHTEASHRYERGVDSQLPYKAIERATALLTAICGGEPGPVVDMTVEAALPQCAAITLRREKLDRLLGHVISEQHINNILHCLGCEISYQNNQWQVIAPSWRFDITIEEDLIEEIARIYGYDKIPCHPVKADLIMNSHAEGELSLNRVKTLLVDRGYSEAITYSFVSSKLQKLLHPLQKSLTLLNPISEETSEMRLSLLPGLLEAVVYNQHRQQNRIRLFECGLRFVPDSTAEHGVRQDSMLAAVITGDRYEEHWDLVSQPVDFYDLKGDLDVILEMGGGLCEIQFKVEPHPALHPGQSASVWLGNECIGFIGVIHPGLENKLGLSGRTVVFEMIWDKLSTRNLPKLQDISRFPANRRDIAIVVPESVTAGAVLTELKKIGGNQVVGVNLFDVYRGCTIAEGYKSLAVSLILQDTARTLEEKEIASTVEKCVEVLKQRFQASLRA